MESDLSKQFYEVYFNRTNREFIAYLTDGRTIRGRFIAFCHREPYSREPYITKWYFVAHDALNPYGLDTFGFYTGEFIQHQHIIRIQWVDNHDEFIFNP